MPCPCSHAVHFYLSGGTVTQKVYAGRVVERASQEEVIVDYANDLDTKRYV